jgi:hypothetical protein
MNDTGLGDAREKFADAFVQALAEMPDVHKDKTAEIETKSGGKFSYAYADLASIIALVRPALAKHGLAVAQAVDTLQPGTVSVTTRVYHQAGHHESFGTLTIVAGDDARRAGSAVTYARRYSLCAALGIAPDEDTDGADVSARPPAADEPRTKPQNNKIHALIAELEDEAPLPDGDWKAYCKTWILQEFGKHSSTELTKSEAGLLIDHLEQQKVPFG